MLASGGRHALGAHAARSLVRCRPTSLVNSAPTRAMASRSEDAMARATELIEGADIMVFSKVSCGFSTRAKQAIVSNVEGAKEKMEVLELDMEPDGKFIQKALADITGQRTVPNVFVKGEHVGGCDDTLDMLSTGAFQRMLDA